MTETRKQAIRLNKTLLDASHELVEPSDIGFELVDILIEQKANERSLAFLLELLTFTAEACAQNVALQFELREKVLKKVTDPKNLKTKEGLKRFRKLKLKAKATYSAIRKASQMSNEVTHLAIDLDSIN